jgi:hypothetical protein
MFPYTDPQFTLDLHNQHAAELRREAAEHRLARSLRAGGRRHLFGRRPRPVRAPVAP